MSIPPVYCTVTFEQIIGKSGDNKKLAIDFVGGETIESSIVTICH